MAIRNLVSRAREHCQAFLEVGVEALIRNALNIADCNDLAKAALRDLGCKVELKELWKGEKNPLEVSWWKILSCYFQLGFLVLCIREKWKYLCRFCYVYCLYKNNCSEVKFVLVCQFYSQKFMVSITVVCAWAVAWNWTISLCIYEITALWDKVMD